LTTLGRGKVQPQQTWYAPEFGLRLRRTTLNWSWEGDLPASLVYVLTPAGERPPDIRRSPDERRIEIDRVLIPF
jgi:hypothetical protein